ncbi:peroxisomal sarcosine oxidase isoform X2 [Chanos chanos]|uniref:Peroxisomal sarcosine oxidase isoform X2 n=1 Tax=Chanos chanos TaxID=29144 RepID=A0A6J2WWQ7_CHACN|nr:peroxisomal sarcosine oxidase-like isoform X2 [Chanos chanos]
MSRQNYDCIVIGAGVQGCFTAYHMAKNKQSTLLLDQFLLPHSRGSSHGQTRIIRKAYEQDFYTHMMEECYTLWAQLEREAGVSLFRRTGILVKGPAEDQDFQLFRDTVQRNAVPTEELTPDQFSRRLPQVTLRSGEGTFIDTTAGVLYADRALRAAQGVFQSLGGVIQDGEKVLNIQPGSTVTVTTACGVYKAKTLVITAGPWANTLLSHTDLQLPLEICYHMGSKTEPDERDRQKDQTDVHVLSHFVSDYLPGLEPEPAVVETCMYTVTPDHHFVLDYHPIHRNIVIGAGFSGHGFKFGPVVGKILCELSLGQIPSYDLSPFKIQRFHKNLRSSL